MRLLVVASPSFTVEPLSQSRLAARDSSGPYGRAFVALPAGEAPASKLCAELSTLMLVETLSAAPTSDPPSPRRASKIGEAWFYPDRAFSLMVITASPKVGVDLRAVSSRS